MVETHLEFRPDDKGEFDEIIARKPDMVHVETLAIIPLAYVTDPKWMQGTESFDSCRCYILPSLTYWGCEMASPYIFCRYQITVDDDVLGVAGQQSFITENNGQKKPFKRRGAESADSNILIMEADVISIEGGAAISFLVGLQAGVRTVTDYDPATQKRRQTLHRDTHIKCAHVIVIPEHGYMAVRDKSNDDCIPQRTALRILRAIVRSIDGADLNIIHLTDADVRRAVSTWDLTDYQYTVRPLNPVSLSDLTNARSDAMKAENIARETGTLKSADGAYMHPNNGPIAQTQEMVDVGYGQNGFRGITPEGHMGHVPKASFHMDRAKNIAEREKPRFLRVIFEAEDGEESTISPIIAASLMRFYTPDEQASDIS